MDKELDIVIELNVGGKKMSTLKSTLSKETDSMLSKIMTGDVPSVLDISGRILLDCDPDIFGHVLDYLRFGLQPPHDKVIHVYEYAKHFGLRKMVNSLEQFKTVKYKKRADEAKSKLDPEKYETFKQNVIEKLAGLSQTKDKCFRIDASNNNPGCVCKVKEISAHRFAIVSEPSILTEMPTDDNLLTALREDLFQLGYGKLRYSREQGHCSTCRQTGCTSIYILLSKKRENENVDTISWLWNII